MRNLPAIPDINKPSSIERIVRAVSHIHANLTRTHSAGASASASASACSDCAQESNSQAMTIEEEIESAKQAMHDEAFAILEANPDIVKRGYFTTHRMIAHLLPREFTWTCNGIHIVNCLLAESPVTKEAFNTWSVEVENHLKEMRERELEHCIRANRYQAENAEQKKIISDEIIHLLRSKDDRVRNYGKLFNHLHRGLGRNFGGSRGAGIIHAAMLEKLKWASYWEKWMQNDILHAKQRDEEIRAARRHRYEQRRQEQTSEYGKENQN